MTLEDALAIDWGQVWENHDETPIRGDLPPMRGRR